MDVGISQTFRCRADTVPRVREVVGAELRRNGIEGELYDRLVLACAEACNNAILHSDSPSYDVTIKVEGNACTVTVRDSGGGFDVPELLEMPAPDAVSRRGLALMSVLVDDLDVTSTKAGTTVVLRQHLNGAGAPAMA